jgi:prepilin-type N-terminal cleavage/methylation domain-containing protein
MSNYSSSFGRREKRDAFTLVELMVVLVIVAMLASLTLAGLGGVRQRAKADKTRSTIRKIDSLITPHYESYLTRRVVATNTSPMVCVGTGTFVSGGSAVSLATGTSSGAINRLWALRLAMVLEMPDQWADVMTPGSSPAIPRDSVTAPVRRYARYKFQLSPSGTFQSAECLAMIVMRGGVDPDATATFRADEIGDVDKDGAPEFKDGWGSPIAFIRWPAGYGSPTTLDPFDPMRVSNPSSPNLTPLIYSPGPDEALNSPTDSATSGYGLSSSFAAVPNGWVSVLTTSGSRTSAAISTQQGSFFAGSLPPATDQSDEAKAKRDAARDNITNYDLR